ncbi:unnamed protein product, partial [Polarella glacialis]
DIRLLVDEETPPAAPLRMRMQCQYGDECRRGNVQHWVDESHPGDPDTLVEQPLPLPRLGVDAALPSRDGSFNWIRFANDPADRDLRAASTSLSLRVCRSGGYHLGGVEGVARLQHVEKLLRGTKLLTVQQVERALASRYSPGKVAKLSVAAENTALEAALARQRSSPSGMRVAVLGAAS